MNFVEKILSNGFERYVSEAEKKIGRYDVSFNTKNGWMGLVVYHPYEYFTKGEFRVELSLEMFQHGQRIIKISDGKNILYENNYGLMPPKEIIDLICN